MTSNDECRAAFEKWAKNSGWESGDNMQRYDSASGYIQYRNDETHSAWVGFKAAWQLRTPSPAPSDAELMEAIKQLMPFEVVQGDQIHRTNPSSRQVVNTSTAWVVSNADNKSAHKLRAVADTINRAMNALKE